VARRWAERRSARLPPPGVKEYSKGSEVDLGAYMLRRLFQLLGIVLLALAFIFVVYDGMKSIADHMLYATRLEQFWIDVHGRSLQMLRDMVERNTTSAVWQWLISPILGQPVALVFGALSIILILMGRKKRPLIGYARD
jgi:hypothetical protein